MSTTQKAVEFEIVHRRKMVKTVLHNVHKTNPREQNRYLDTFPVIDRSLIDYEKYNNYVGHAGVKHSMAIQATRGCPYKCFYCDIYKTSPTHFRRSVDNFFNEVKVLADIGVKQFEFIDDIFNVNRKSCMAFFQRVIDAGLDIQFYFPTGLKGDLMDKELLDVMVEAGCIGFNMSLEHASPRMQEVMRKGLDVEKLHENLTYLTEKHPHVNLTMNAMHGFPTETEEEAMETLNYIRSIKWLDFPYLHNVRIFPGTEIEHFALEAGIPRELIEQAQDMSYHEQAPTLPFSAEFTRKVRTIFTHDYVLNRERLLARLPYQMEYYSEDELNQKYNAYFPSPKIKTLDDVLKLVKIDRSELRVQNCRPEETVRVPELTSKLKAAFPKKPLSEAAAKEPLKLLLVDMSSYFEDDFNPREYNVLEPPYGLMALMTYVNEHFAGQVEGKLCKSLIDFNSYDEFLKLVEDFKPDLIGLRAMTFYSGFFHDAIAHLRDNGVETPIIAGGPYPTASYSDVLQDRNIDLAVIAEGEITLGDILQRCLDNGNKLPDKTVLKDVPGIAFYDDEAEVREVENTAAIPVTGFLDKVVKNLPQ